MKFDIKRLLTLDKCTALVTIIGFPLLLASLISAVVLDRKVSRQIEELTTIAKSQKEVADDQLKIAKSQNNIALNQMFYGDPRNVGIIEAIESKKSILKTPGGDGQFSNAQLDKFLCDLETVYDVYDEGLLTDTELCGSFSVYIQEVEANQEIKDYLKANAKYFSGLPDLFAIVDKSKNEYCHD
jgi:hypothetical protein